MEKSRNTYKALKPRRFGRQASSLLVMLGVIAPVQDAENSYNNPEVASQLLVKAEQAEAAKLTLSAITRQTKLIPRAGSYYGTKWTGYEINANQGEKFDKVAGEFQVPRLSCPAYPFNGKVHGATIFLGIDGFRPSGGSNTVEQLGIEEMCYSYNPATRHQKPYYSLFYETYPDKPMLIPEMITAGNTISGEVNYSGGNYSFSLDNLSTHDPYTSKPLPCAAESGCTRNTVEWIVENDYSVLANFNTTVFRDDKASTTNTALSLGSYMQTNQYDAITAFHNGLPFAVPGPVVAGGEVFSVRWQN